MKLLVCYPLKAPAEALDDVEQMFAHRKVDMFIDPNNYPSLRKYLSQYGIISGEQKIIVISDGENT